MDRILRIAMAAARWAAGVAALLAVALAILLYTPPGHRALGLIVARLTDGAVTIEGLDGDLPNHLRARSVDIADSKGVWLRIEGLALDWNALAAIGDRYSIQTAAATRIVALRRPVAKESKGRTPEIDIHRLDAPDIELARSIAGRAARLRAGGSFRYSGASSVAADLLIERLDKRGRYMARGSIDGDSANGVLNVSEGSDGLLAALLGLPGLGPVDLEARAGSAGAASRVAFRLSAGALTARGGGAIRPAARHADIDVALSAPAMRPSADLAWRSLAMDAHVHGDFEAPRIEARLAVLGAEAFATKADEFRAQLTGADGTLELFGAAIGLAIPGQRRDVFSHAPVVFLARADLDKPSRPVAFVASHALLTVEGRAQTRGPPHLSLNAQIPSLAPFAAMANQTLAGSARFSLEAAQDDGRTTLRLNGRVETLGEGALARALGRNATIKAEAALSESELLHSSVAIDAAALRFDAQGSFRRKRLDYRVELQLSDLARLVPTLDGSASFSGTIAGPLESAVTRLTGRAWVASKGFKRRQIDLSGSATGFPRLRQAQLRVSGSLNDAPISARADLAGGKGRSALTASVAWKSLRASTDLSLSPDAAGKVAIDVGSLADIGPFLSMRLGGALAARADLSGKGASRAANVEAKASNLHIDDAKAGVLTASGRISDPFGAPSLSLGLTARDVSAFGLSGEGAAKLGGPFKALAISLDVTLDDRSGAPVSIGGAGTLDANGRRFALGRLALSWRGRKASLAEPATFDFARGLSVDRFAIVADGGTARLSGRLSPDLSAQVSARSLPAGLLSPLLSQPLEGTISADARLAGTLDAPRGSYDIAVRGLAARAYSATTTANIDAKGVLDGRNATVEAAASAGASAHLSAGGVIPLRAAGAITMRASGTLDLSIVNPLIAAEGRRVRGTASVDLHADGTLSAPRIEGGASVKGGEFQDYARGARLRAITADIRVEGTRLRIADLTASAGPGTIKGSGSIDLSAPGTPVDVSLRLDNAQPIASDLLTARASGDLRVAGALRGSVAISGTLDVSRATIDIPERFPPQIAVLDVRRKGWKPPPEAKGGDVALDIALSTSGPIFVRGRGLDADMSGDIRLGGTIAAPVATGKFEMNRGTVTLAGQTLTFTTGKLGFDGAGIRNRLDPSLDFVAQSASGGVTATLAVGGHASAPKITLSSAPQLPQDEVLARLLFQQSAKQLTPLQLAQIAQAIAALGGVGTGFDPLGALRKSLGLDRLSIGSASGGASGSQTETTVEGGKYVSRNVYVGAKQTLSGSSLVQVQVDLTKKLKAQATISTGSNATATKGSAAIDNGSSVGLTYEFEY